MPRRIFQQAKFNGGMILNADPSDLADGFGVACIDAMPSVDTGLLVGRYQDLPASAPHDSYVNVEQYGYITKDGITTKFVHFGADKVYLDGVESDLSDATCITTHQDYALVGRSGAHVARYLNYDGVNCDNIMDASDVYHYIQYLPVIVGGEVTSWDTNTHFHASNPSRGAFQEDYNYTGPYWDLGSGDKGFVRKSRIRYAFSFIYDGFYHSPLSQPIEFSMDYTGGSSDSGYIKIYCPTMPEHDRVTGLNVYRSVIAPGLSSEEGSEYCLVKSFTGTVTNFSFTDYADPATEGFAALSGLSESLASSTLGYSCAYEMNNFLFVGNVSSNALVLNGGRLLYRSIRGKPAQFTIISDYIALPFTPVAITSFNKRLIVFGTEAMAIVDPEAMAIEEVIKGYGITSPLLLYSSPVGLFFANDTNMFVYDGREVVPIGDPVLRVADLSVWTTLIGLGVMSYVDLLLIGGIQRIIYSAKTNSILFLYEVDIVAGGVTRTTQAFSFSIDRKTWSVLTFPSCSNPKSAYLDLDNRLYLDQIEVMASRFPVTNWKFLSRRFNFGTDSQIKKVYAVHADITSPSTDVSMIIDGTWSGSLTPGTRLFNLMLKYVPTVANAVLDTIEIVYREMAHTT